MQTINRFSGSMVTDLDYSDIKPNQLSFPSLNVRIYNKEGQGFIATNAKGNKYSVDDAIGFKLSDGFVGVGGAEHNGILYILSWSDDLQQGEIGSFPSPNSLSFTSTGTVMINTSLTGFGREYKPLSNLSIYGGSARSWLRADKLNFGFYMQELIIKPSYDNSVGLYICNGRTPNLVINSGFTSQGLITGRVFTIDMFDSILRQILPINNVIQMNLSSIEENGRFQPGNYFVYVKYLDQDFNSTKYITSIGPVCINNGTGMYDSEGVQEKDWIENETNYTNKSIKVFIDPNSIDDTFKYVKFSIIRYTAFSENGNATTEIFSINKEFNIDNIISNGGIIEITGNETLEVASFSEIISQDSIYNISESHTIVNKRYFGVNWKSEVEFSTEMNTAFTQFAQLIETSYDIGTSLPDYDSAIGDFIPFGYKDSEKVTTDLGYFDGEMYPVGIRIVFKGGAETDTYPIKSKDLMDPGHILSSAILAKGIIRLPDEREIFNTDPLSGVDYVLKLKFLINAAMSFKDTSAYFDDVIGFYFVKGEKIDNLLTQGVMFRTTRSILAPNEDGDIVEFFFDGADGGNSEDARFIPVSRDIIPLGFRTAGQYFYHDTTSDPNFSYQTVLSESKFAIYSADKLCSNFKVPEDTRLYFKPIYQVHTNNEVTATNLAPHRYMSFQSKANTLQPFWLADNKHYAFKGYNIAQGVGRSSSGFVSFFTDGETGLNTDYGYRKETVSGNVISYNRSVFSPTYIGADLIDETIGQSLLPLAHFFIVNIYISENNNDLFDLKASNYDPATNEYSRISQVIEINESITTHIIAGGDNFKQRTYFRQTRFYGFDTNSDPDHRDQNWVRYNHGVLFGFMMSSYINSAMRNEVDFDDGTGTILTYTYYPKLLESTPNPRDWICKTDRDDFQIEAFQVNDGYNKTINSKTSLGNDADKIVIDPHRENRAYFSSPLVSGSFIDQFREILSVNYKDFIIEDSPIIKVIEHKGKVICVTRNKIFQIYVDDRLVQSNASGDNVIANAESFLSDNVNVLAEYGIQHKTAIIKTENAIYGWDYIRSIIFRISLSASESPGRYFLKAEDLTKTKFYQKAVLDLKASNDLSDIVSNPNDDVLNGDGIVLGYNKKYDEIYFTLLSSEGSIRSDTTIIFSELIDGFTPNRSLDTTSYLELGDGLYSNKPIKVGSDLVGSEYYYKEDEGDPQVFYDEIQPFKLSFIVNGNSDQQNSSMITKIFEALEIEMPDTLLTSILYETEYQTSIYTFTTTDIAEKPEYYKNKWQVPISLQTSVESGQYDEGSEMEGTWIKITLQYNPSTTPEEIYIKKVISNFVLKV